MTPEIIANPIPKGMISQVFQPSVVDMIPCVYAPMAKKATKPRSSKPDFPTTMLSPRAMRTNIPIGYTKTFWKDVIGVSRNEVGPHCAEKGRSAASAMMTSTKIVLVARFQFAHIAAPLSRRLKSPNLLIMFSFAEQLHQRGRSV